MIANRRSFLVGTGATVATSSSLFAQGPHADLGRIVRNSVVRGFFGSVLVARGADLVLHDGFGYVGSRSVAAHDKYWISSTAKQFVSAAVLALVDSLQLKLSDPLSRFFPRLSPEKAPISMRQLLSHTSGFGQGYAGENQTTLDAAVVALLAEPLVAAPGERFQYSNTNYDLATAIVETVSGKAFADFVKSRLWDRVHLDQTGFADTATESFVLPVRGMLPERLKQASWGGHGAYSSTGDLFRWYRALTAGLVISRENLAQLFMPATRIGEGEAALGWFLGRTSLGNPTRFTRGNDDFGPNSLIYAYPDQDVVIVILTHSGDASEDVSWSRAILADLQRALNL